MLHLGELGAALAEKVLQYWMKNIGRSLTNYQVILRVFKIFPILWLSLRKEPHSLRANRHPNIKDL